MASITLCPRCSSHLELPTGVAPTSLVECPICEAEFLLASVAPRAVPKARVVEQQMEPAHEESATTLRSASTLGIIVDENIEEPAAAASAQDNLSRLLRSSAGWQIPGVQLPASEETELDVVEDVDDHEPSLDLETDDDRIITNDHVPSSSKSGATLDAAYRDADPELAAQPPTQANELKLAGSRLDQLLSDLMKSPSASATTPAEVEAASRGESPSLPNFAELEEHDEAEEKETTRSEQRASSQSVREVEAFNDSSDQAEAEQDDESHLEYVDEETSRDEEFETLNLQTTPRRKRRPAGLRTLVGVVGGGAIGILGGAYALLWLRGPDVDLLGLAKWLPPAMLPTSAQPLSTNNLADANASTPNAPAEPLAAEDETNDAPPQSTTLVLADPPSEPVDDELAGNNGADSTAASPTEPPALHEDADVVPAGATQPLSDPAETADIPEAAVPTLADAPAHWPTTPIVGQLRGMTHYSVADLDSLLVGADAAHRRFLAGDLSRKDDVAAMGQAYIELCRLAEQFTLTNPAEFGNDLITKQMSAKNIFRGAVGDPARRNDLAMIAGRWLQHNRRPNQGVVVLGKVTDLHAQGHWTEYTIETPLGDATATSKVLIDGVPFASGSDVAVVGAIVADPRQAIAGYEGDAPQVIVSGFAFVPEDFAAPKIGESANLFSTGQ